MKKLCFAFLCGVCCAAVSVAGGRADKGRFEIGAMGGGIQFEGNSIFDEDELLGGWIGYYLTNCLSVEASFLKGDTEILNSSYQSDMSIPLGELQYNFSRCWLQPFFTVGAGGMILEPESASGLNNQSNFIAGYGLGLKMFFNDKLSARLHARHYIDTEISEAKNYGMLTAGISWLFGGIKEIKEVVKQTAKVVLDSDNDGVNDNADACPNTPSGAAVDSTGCPLDGDSDGIPDYADACSNTPLNTKVDAKGCPIPEFLANPEKEWVLSNLEFDSGKDTIKPSSIPTLNEAAQIMNDNPSVIIEIQGHTDSAGSEEANQALSLARATAVKNQLIEKGVAENRMSVMGYGESKPIADNATAEGRAKNRRIQFKVISK